MRVPRNLGSFAAALACINLLLPLQLLQAADSPVAQTASSQPSSPTPPAVAKSATLDVVLSPTRELRGQLVDQNNMLLADRVVVAVHADRSILQTVSDSNGRFRFPNAKPGMYDIGTKQSHQVCRCWTANAKPPSASTTFLLVEGDQTLRGQRPIGELLSGPVLIGLIIAAAIIIPIAVHNSQKSAS